MKPTVTAVLIAAVGFVVAAWLMRYEITAAGAAATYNEGASSDVRVIVFRLDRWTGNVIFCGQRDWKDCVEEQ